MNNVKKPEGSTETGIVAAASEKSRALACRCRIGVMHAMRRVREESGQGTTEYAILVGVLVVIAIVAVMSFKGKIQELWNAIADGVNSL